jgi:capsular exopolysaccharide synthesis family protein
MAGDPRANAWRPGGAAGLPASDDAIRLVAKLRAVTSDAERIILLTGVAAGDGVSRAAAQLAVALAQTEQTSVLLVDANLRAPVLHRLFDVPPAPGLSELLQGQARLEDVRYQTTTASLVVLPAGALAVDPLSLFASSDLATLTTGFRREHRFVLIDAAPILRFADAALLARRTDGIVVVLAAGRRRRADVERLRQELEGLATRTIGVILSHR